MDKFIDEFENLLIESGLASKFNIKGCSEEEVIKLERYFELRLPVVYRDFLLRMGHRAGSYHQGTDIFYSDIFSNREGLEELLEEDNFSVYLEQTFFVFSCHQGYIYHFFDIRESLIDPPVYGYKEGDLQFKRINDAYSSFLLRSLEDEKRLRGLT
jgi:SMI1-KNR4 cell-wall